MFMVDKALKSESLISFWPIIFLVKTSVLFVISLAQLRGLQLYVPPALTSGYIIPASP